MGQGLWPAFWMLGANFDQVSWPQCGEIDIMEHINNESVTNGTVHWNNNGGHGLKGSSVPIDENLFHVYGAIWNDAYVQFYVDDFIYYQYNYASYNNAAPIFQLPFFLLLNVAVGGNWPGNPDGSTIFPDTMEVDYIRVYEQANVNVAEISNAPSFSVYPNPFGDELTVSLKNNTSDWQYTIHNAIGELITEGTFNNQSNMINAAGWPKGIFQIHVFNEKHDLSVLQIVR